LKPQLLVHGIVQQTMVLIAQIATVGGVRAPLARVANQVFLDLTNELAAQGLGRHVIADMFGWRCARITARCARWPSRRPIAVAASGRPCSSTSVSTSR
jgi:hypothetical protein